MPATHPSRSRLLSAYYPLLVALSLLVTSAVQAADSAPNRVLRLDGEGDYVQLPSHIFDDLEQATIEAWVKWESFGWYEQWFGYGSGAKKQLLGIHQTISIAGLRFFIYDRDRNLRLVSSHRFYDHQSLTPIEAHVL